MSAFETTIKLRFYDMDRAGMVFHGAYTRIFQDAFEELMEHTGYVEKNLEQTLGVRVPVVRHEMEFPNPPTGDELTVAVGVERLGDASVRFGLLARDEENKPAARAEIVRVCIDAQGEATPIPDELRDAWRSFETATGPAAPDDAA